MTAPDVPHPAFLRARLRVLEQEMEDNTAAEGADPTQGQAIRWLIAVTEHIDVAEQLERAEAAAGGVVCRPSGD